MSTNHNLSQEKGEPKRYRTEVLLLTSLTPYRLTKPAHRLEHSNHWFTAASLREEVPESDARSVGWER